MIDRARMKGRREDEDNASKDRNLNELLALIQTGNLHSLLRKKDTYVILNACVYMHWLVSGPLLLLANAGYHELALRRGEDSSLPQPF